MASLDRYVSAQADINVRRSKFPLSRRTLLSYMHGYLQPVGAPIEVLPGDTFSKVNLSVFTRMSTPIVPFVDNVRQECDVFFVPKRILWNKTKQFYGESPSFGIATPVYEPSRNFAQHVSDLNTNEKKCESFAAAFGLIWDGVGGSSGHYQETNILPIRSFLAVYNEYYRNENYQDQYSWDKDASGSVSQVAFINGSAITSISLLPKVNKDKDLFTSILPYQVKGNPVALSIGGRVPVITGDVNTALVNEGTYDYALKSGTKPLIYGHDNAFNLNYATTRNLGVQSSTTAGDKGKVKMTSNDATGSDAGFVAPINLYADLGAAAQASISDLLYSLSYQDFLARCAHFGTRYKEYIYGMFGTRIADATEDIPEYLGRLKFNINVQQVVQTTGFQASAGTELGALGAYSNSGKSGQLFTKSFTEPGYVVLVSYTKHQRTYTSGLDRVWFKKELLDYYQPPFANIADIPIESNLLWYEGTSDIYPLGFQEPWFEYHSLEDRAYGMMNAKIDTMGQIWTLADVYSSAPTIGAQFMMEDRDAIARVLSTGVNGPDYIMDFQLDIEATRVMPLYASGKLGRF